MKIITNRFYTASGPIISIAIINEEGMREVILTDEEFKKMVIEYGC